MPTIVEFESANEIFDRVKDHLLTQGVRSSRPMIADNGYRHTMCTYRGPEGRSCAIGCLIPDEAYDETIEGLSATSIDFKKAIKFATKEPADFLYSMLDDLQWVHDECDPVEWEATLTDVENRYFKGE